MRRLLAVTVLLALVAGVGTAVAARGDPQKKLTSADNARARAMLIRKGDLVPGFTATRPSSEDPDIGCKALDESDLTLTGEAESPSFTQGVAFVSSSADLYASRADARASWRRGTSAGGLACLKELLRVEYGKQGLTLQSMRKIAFPRVSSSTAAYRFVISMQSQGVEVPFFLDLVVLMNSRAQVGLLFGSALVAVPRTVELPLARLTAERMAKAMRGA